MAKAQVFSDIQGDFDVNIGWPTGSKLVFDGYITGVGYRKQGGQLQFVVTLVHWLSDLSFSSTLSQQSHPANPTSYTFPAVYPNIFAGGNAAVGGLPAMTAISFGADVFDPENIITDFWGKTLKPFFASLSEQDLLLPPDELAGVVQEGGRNAAALRALSRIEGVGGIAQDLPLSKYNVPLGFTALDNGGIATQISLSILKHVEKASLDSIARSTIWDVLVGNLAGHFMFALVPCINKALVVPFAPGLQTPYRRTILSNDFEFIDLHTYIPRPVRAVAVMADQEFFTGGHNAGGEANPDVAALAGVGGVFVANDVPAGQGMIRFIGPPTWLAGIPSEGSSPLRTSGVGQRIACGTATTPMAGSNANLVGGAGGMTQGQVALQSVDIFNRFAQSAYVADALRGRTGQLVGKLRFDIAPGSNVFIEGQTEQFIGAADQLGDNAYATVVKVSIGMDAEASKAGTNFQLLHIRNTKENQLPSTSIAAHPLYSKQFLGAPLSDDYAF
jgi:hypothetical protein